MKWRFQWLYWFGLAVFAAVAFWTVWGNAQTPPATNAPALTVTNTLPTFGVTNALTEKLANVPWLSNTTFLGEPLWKYFASLIYILLAFYVSKLLDYIINVWLKRLAAKTENKYDDILLELLRGPVKVVSFVIFLHIGLGVFDWPPRAQVFLSRGLIVVVACSITYVVLRIVDVFLGVWREKVSSAEDKLFAEHLFPVIRKAAKTGVIIAAVLLTADNLHIEIKTLLAGLSIGGLALGLAAQDTVANLFGAVAVFLDKPFRIGDMIKVEGVQGTVEQIGIRSTRLRNLDGHFVTIPNKTMGNTIITNIAERPSIRTEMNIGITYDTPAEKVKRATAILNEIFRGHPRTKDLIISFNKFNDSALNLLVVHVWDGTDGKEHFAGLQELNLRVKERFDAEKIEFAFPSQTVYLKQDAAGAK
ncbi:MAG: mechanosensitive ion channel family protein [Verrucomicrobiota bacterium]